MADDLLRLDHVNWYRDQVVFLTGATGNLGGCILYKLAVQLPTKKVYVLCRRSFQQAMEKWEASMPEQVEEIFDSGKVHCIIGDTTEPHLGLRKADRDRLQQEVTVIIHSAASISMFQELHEAVQQHCSSMTNMIQLACQMTHLQAFVYISSITVCMLLSDGTAKEQFMKVTADEPDPEEQVASILATHSSPYSDRFPTSYSQAKYLAERLLFAQEESFPVLVVRPASIGPAIRDPYPLYGVPGSTPVDTAVHLFTQSGVYRSFSETKKFSQETVVDEIPVDLTANGCLLHVACGSRGIVHLGCQLYIPRTLSDLTVQWQKYGPKDLEFRMARLNKEQNGALARQAYDTMRRGHRGWFFDCSRSQPFQVTEGPIGLSLANHDFEEYAKARVEKQGRILTQQMKTWDLQG
ncbi:putative PKS/NRPS-like protein biosynthetic cluster [Aspergillus tubingensis]|uniref:Fatty acyl-CoA reductase n=2 Tax=Aspergillus tubingensis TaxID=5068 RepID=A0A1L9ND61_ASPTC|nr:hypothetical protein ASPTUDRAFT_40381 [Aspergillus tubingensis CBS 134.48]GLA68505.1 putative PKS/NRPS-like protein biosynthetic cluster [Aspergillus tubingensis]GLA88714.1 putative PKS/NRPS-like protein biosynthetic cluster [Aspergillus tubingensis]